MVKFSTVKHFYRFFDKLRQVLGISTVLLYVDKLRVTINVLKLIHCQNFVKAKEEVAREKFWGVNNLKTFIVGIGRGE